MIGYAYSGALGVCLQPITVDPRCKGARAAD